MRRNIMTITLLFFCLGGTSQEVQMDKYGEGFSNTYSFYETNGAKNILPYSRISGSPFWKDNWMSAKLFTDGEKLLGIYKTKINIATNEVYFLNADGKPLVALPGVVKRVGFVAAPSSEKIITLFSLVNGVYAEVLNEGAIKLLRYQELDIRSRDSLFSSLKSYYFQRELHYYLLIHDSAFILKWNFRLKYPLKVAKTRTGSPDKKKEELPQDHLLKNIPDGELYEQWAKDLNINFKKEEDVLLFLNYYNSNHK
jgi:hypothetical protein